MANVRGVGSIRCGIVATVLSLLVGLTAQAGTTASPESKPLSAASASKAPGSKPDDTGLGKGDPKLSASMVQTLASLVGVVALIVVIGGTVRLVSRRSGGLMAALGAGGRAPSGLLEVLGRYPVGRGSTLILLKMDRRVLLLSQGGGGKLGGATMTTLCEVTDAEDVASILLKVRDEEGDTLARKFQGMLSGAERAATASLEEEQSTPRRLDVGLDSFDLAKARSAKATPTSSQASQPTPIRNRLDSMRAPAARRAGSGGVR
jgi:hypothetical protein